VQPSVLVIDDDVLMTEMIKIILEPKAFGVNYANSGAAGIEKARILDPDIIILDLCMPEMDGEQVCKAIREFSQVPILILSAMNKPGLISKTLDEGADDYLFKPVPSGVLIAHLNSLIRRSHLKAKVALPREI
jgi:two-component system KDP operon response regulator KdpE